MDKAETRRSRAKIQDVREQRATATPFELREARNGDYILEGYASTWEPYDCYGGVELGGWIEQLDRRAFDKTLAESPDLQLLINHEGMPLARTKSGTLELSTDRMGLRVRAYLDPRDPDVQALLPKMQRGDMDEMSFAFRVKEQEWDREYTHRNITEVSLQKGDVSVVNYGMNPTTKASIMVPSAVEALAHVGERELAELRKLPKQELDSAMEAILLARGIPLDNFSVDELDDAIRRSRGYNLDSRKITSGILRGLDAPNGDSGKKKDDDEEDEKPTEKKSDDPADDDEEKPGDKEAKEITELNEEMAATQAQAVSGLRSEEIPYADPGYLDDGKRRYPLDTESHVRAAWAHAGKAEGYTPEQLAKVKGEIRTALKAFGITVPTEKVEITDIVLRKSGNKLVPVALFNDGTTFAVTEEQASAWRRSQAVSQRLQGGNTQRLEVEKDGTGDPGSISSTSMQEIDSQDDTTPGSTSAAKACSEVTKDEYCPVCGEPHTVDLPPAHSTSGPDLANDDSNRSQPEPSDRIPPSGKPDGEDDEDDDDEDDDKPSQSSDSKDSSNGDSDSDDEEDDEDDEDQDDEQMREWRKSISPEILAELNAERRKRAGIKEAVEEDPRKRNYKISRGLQELFDSEGEGTVKVKEARKRISSLPDYHEPEPEPEPAPPPAPPAPPALSLQEAFRELRGGEDAIALERAEQATSQDISTPELVERLINPPPPPEPEPEPEPEPRLFMREAYEALRDGDSVLDIELAEQEASREIETPELIERLMQPPPEPEPEPEPEPVDVRAELDRFLAEDRKRYTLEEALERARSIVDPDPASPHATGIDAGWDAIDEAIKPFLKRDTGVA